MPLLLLSTSCLNLILLHELVDDNPQLRRQFIAAYLISRRVRPNEYRYLPPLRASLATGGIAPSRGLLATNPLT